MLYTSYTELLIEEHADSAFSRPLTCGLDVFWCVNI